MTDKEFGTLKHKDIFKENARGQVLLTTEVKANTSFLILKDIDDLQEHLLHINPNARIRIHCLWENDGHTKGSKHYLKIRPDGTIECLALACDFDIENMNYKEAYEAVMDFLQEKNLFYTVGMGLYPDWNNPGFHLDHRGEKRRWSEIAGVYQAGQAGFDKAVALIVARYAPDNLDRVSRR